MICAALENGATSAAILEEVSERCDFECDDADRCKRQKAEVAAVAMAAIEANNLTIAIADEALKAMGLLFQGLRFILQRSGVGAVASVPISTIVTSIITTRRIVASRRAANDEVFDQIRRLAA